MEEVVEGMEGEVVEAMVEEGVDIVEGEGEGTVEEEVAISRGPRGSHLQEYLQVVEERG